MRILITGKNSYIGSSVKAWLNEKNPSFKVDEISLRNIDLNTISFRGYDVVFHVAGIAHFSFNKKSVPEYFKINRDLAINVANKAKKDSVKQFIFTSSISIYGDDRPIGVFKHIDINHPLPTNAYGQSKLEADLEIQKLNDHGFKVSILRIPMIYGKSSKGNFPKLVNISKNFFVFPKIKNFRSVLHIKNLSELVRLIIVNSLGGVFYPQDKNYFNSTEFILNNRAKSGKKTILVPLLFAPLRLLGLFNKSINKIYGNKFYDKVSSIIENINYQIFSYEDFIIEMNNIN